ncbi:hypothetical protein SK128_015547 [Halocaridina rubra]|uniref:Uncharacterized protein n=1 Tax=Halocaridina rubra TaxID=373956 RepID=A0AAN8XDG1_HALRR
MRKVLQRLTDSESGFTILEAILAQTISSNDNSTYWYYSDNSSDIIAISSENYEPDVHIGRSILTLFPITLYEDGDAGPLVLLRTFPVSAGKPIIQPEELVTETLPSSFLDITQASSYASETATSSTLSLLSSAASTSNTKGVSVRPTSETPFTISSEAPQNFTLEDYTTFSTIGTISEVPSIWSSAIYPSENTTHSQSTKFPSFTSDIPSYTTSPSSVLDLEKEQGDTIVQIDMGTVDDCEEENEINKGQAIFINNLYEEEDMRKVLERLTDSESGFMILEAILAQTISLNDNSTYWYYTDNSSDIIAISSENYDPDVHIGRSILTLFPITVFEDGSAGPLVFLRTYPVSAGKPIIQLVQDVLYLCETSNQDDYFTFDWPDVMQNIYETEPDMEIKYNTSVLTEHIRMLSSAHPYDRIYHNSSSIVDIEEIFDCAVLINNLYKEEDMRKVLNRLSISESGFTILETVITQNINSVDKSTHWYYTDDSNSIITVSDKLVQNVIYFCETCNGYDDPPTSFEWPDIIQKLNDRQPNVDLNSNASSFTEHIRMLSSAHSYNRTYYNISSVVDIEEEINCPEEPVSEEPEVTTLMDSKENLTVADITLSFTPTPAVITTELHSDVYNTLTSGEFSSYETEMHASSSTEVSVTPGAHSSITATAFSNFTTETLTSSSTEESKTFSSEVSSALSSSAAVSQITTISASSIPLSDSSESQSGTASPYPTIPNLAKEDLDALIEVDMGLIRDSEKDKLNAYQAVVINNTYDEGELRKVLHR